MIVIRNIIIFFIRNFTLDLGHAKYVMECGNCTAIVEKADGWTHQHCACGWYFYDERT